MIRYLAQAGKAAKAKEALEALVQVVVAEEAACKGIWIHENTTAPEQPHIREFTTRAREFIAGPPRLRSGAGSGARRRRQAVRGHE